MTSFLFAILVIGPLALWWRASMEARALANAAAKDACRAGGAQLLDGTVVFRSLAFGRNQGGFHCIKRTYIFDYTEDGVSRRHGSVILAGHDVDTVGLGPTLAHSQPSGPPSA